MNEVCRVTDCYTITFERSSRHSAARVWRAITEPAEVGAWLEGRATIDLRRGGEWFVDYGGDDTIDAIIVHVEKERRLAFVWGSSVVEWTLEPDGDGCKLTLVHNGAGSEAFGDRGCVVGWHGSLDELGRYIDGVALSADERRAHWDAIVAEYRSHFSERLEAIN